MSKINQRLDSILVKLHAYMNLEGSTIEDEGMGKFIRVVIAPETSEKDESYALFFLSDGNDDISADMYDWEWYYQDSTKRVHCICSVTDDYKEVVSAADKCESKVAQYKS